MTLHLTDVSHPESYKWNKELTFPQVAEERVKARKSGKPQDTAMYALTKRHIKQYGEVPGDFFRGGGR